MKYLYSIGLILLFLFVPLFKINACRVSYDPNIPIIHKSSIVINTDSADIYTTFDKGDYIKILNINSDSCGPYQTYIRKEIIFTIIPLILIIGYFLIKRKNKNDKINNLS